MKKARKLLVALLVLTFLLGTFNVGFVAAADEKLPSHVVRALGLGYLKGYGDGQLKLDQPITRAEALAFIVRISGMEKSAELMKGQTKFADVNSDPSLQWATGYINLGVGHGIINGYPDGTFKGNAQVTYAEMAKMLLYAMNYGVTVEGGVWPVAVMGKAESLGVFNKVNASPNVPAVRGDVVKMIDNCLGIHHLIQKGYGDLAFYEEDPNTTFLTKMNVEEIEGSVTAIPRVDDKLKADRIKIGNVRYKLVADADKEELFGQKVTAYVVENEDDDDEIIFINIDSEYFYDALKDVSSTELTLVDADEDYDIASGAVVYIDGVKKSPSNLASEYDYAKIVLNEDGEVEFIDAYNWEGYLVVEEVEDEVVYGYGDELDVEDFTIVKDGKVISVDDVKEGDILFFNSKAGDGYAEVFNKTVEGEIEKVLTGKIVVNDKDYKYANDFGTAKYLDGNKLKDFNDDVAEEMEDEGGKVTLFLDRKGKLVYVVGDRGVSAKSTVVGYLYDDMKIYKSRGQSYLAIDIVNENGKVVSYDVRVKDVDDHNLDLTGKTDGDVVVDKDQLIKLKVDADGDVVEIWKAGATDFSVKDFNDNYDVDDKYIEGKRVKSSTVVFLVEEYLDSDDEDDIEVVQWADIDDFEKIYEEVEVNDDPIKSRVYFDDKNYATYIIAVKTDVDDKTDDVKALITSMDQVKGTNQYRIKAFIDGVQKTIFTKDDSSISSVIDSVYQYRAATLAVNKASGNVDRITVIDPEVEGAVQARSISDKTIKVGGTVYYLVDDYQVFDATDPDDVEKITLRDIEVGDKVQIILDSDDTSFVRFVILTDEKK
jgi:hypothetical protein